MHAGARWAGTAVATAVALTLALAAPVDARPVPRQATSPAADLGPAGDGPGALSHFDLARKDCLGTARNRDSKVWYTVAGGVLSDVYEPTIDTTNVETMQFVVTDGATFTDLQSRDTTYAVEADPTGMVCTVTSTARSGRYQLVATYLTDPERDTVVVRTRLVRLPAGAGGDLRLYVRLDPTVGGHGGGGPNAGADTAVLDAPTGAVVVGDPTTETAARNRDYAVATALALRGDQPFGDVALGFAGAPSDGLAQLDRDHALTARHSSAVAGNVTATARVGLDEEGAAVLALGFGRTPAEAVDVAGRTLQVPAPALEAAYTAGWRAYDAGLQRPLTDLPGLTAEQVDRLGRAYWRGLNVVKASEDKTFPGAIVAGLGSPWGQAVSAGTPVDGRAPYFGSYREVFSRDLYEAFTALLVAGDRDTAQATVRFLLERQQLPDGRLPRNSLLNGRAAPDTGGDQLDETAYPILMALQAGLGGDAALYRDHIRGAADFLVARGPSFGSERWEEQSGYSPSTIAAEIAGLVAAGQIAEGQGDADRAAVYRATADHFQRSIKGWTVTTTGPYSAEPYFIRLSRTGDPNAAVTYNLGNGGPDADQRAVVDAGFQELTRLGILPATDPDVVRSLAVVDRVIRRETPAGTGFYRYGTETPGTEDGYGDCHEPDPTTCSPEGKPWPTGNVGSGHLWPVLSGERAEQTLQTGDVVGAARLLAAMDAFGSGVGLTPEQTWENDPVPPSPFGTPPETASIGFEPGRPAGSAAPLTWAQAQAVRLTLSLGAGRALEQPAEVRTRYLDGGPPPLAPVTVAEPAPGTSVSTAAATVRGTTVPGARVVVAARNLDTGPRAELAAGVAASDGSFALDVPVAFGTTAVTTTVTTPAGATGYDQRTVASDLVGGAVVFDAADPPGDDHGPGTFAYPTAADFRPGAFDLTRFQVVAAGDTVYLRAQLGDLTPTFGNALGAQLLTVFVHEPAATARTTTALYPSRNYSVAPEDAWTRAVQVRGFDEPRLVAADGASVGTVAVQASPVTRYVTMAVPSAALGGVPGPGWAFTVVLHGQDGFGQDGARVFTATPGPYTFGVCPSGATDPHCGLDPAAAPKAMDVLTPAGVDQAVELDATRGPVVVRGVPVTG